MSLVLCPEWSEMPGNHITWKNRIKELKIELPENSKKCPLDRRRNPGYSAFS